RSSASFLYICFCNGHLLHSTTPFRSLFCLFFFATVILEAIVGQPSPFGPIFVRGAHEVDYVYATYYLFVILLLAEVTLFVFTVVLAIGVIDDHACYILLYLTSRFSSWLAEVIALSILTIIHRLLIGWYLGM
ncbi:unnamed protein product, partial [Leptidea sinapis]